MVMQEKGMLLTTLLATIPYSNPPVPLGHQLRPAASTASAM
jgi:hypothetical protein